MKAHLILILTALTALPALAEEPDTVSTLLDEIVIESDSHPRLRSQAFNVQLVTQAELKRAACCNLGESFTTNPSVDVSYNDAATGARQIRLLGLSGQYVQMLTENVPAFRGAARPYGLGYLAGPWLQSIQVSKGTASVKNGQESITGQINVEMLKPQADPSLSLNAYADADGRVEANATGNLRLSPSWSTGLLLHAENAFAGHDTNGDSFLDMPKVRQFTAANRWAYMGEHYVFQMFAKYLDERRRSGQDAKHAPGHDMPLYRIGIDTRRAEVFTKNAFIFDKDNDGNVALILSGSWHDMDAAYGQRYYDVIERELYASLMFERKFTPRHALSVGLSYNHDGFRRHTSVEAPGVLDRENENIFGGYAQYTYNLDDALIAMAGMRMDRSDLYGTSFTPRAHVRWNISDVFSWQLSAGRGRRSPHPMEEYSYLLASSRTVNVTAPLRAETATNAGTSLTARFTAGWRKISLEAEYYYTLFNHSLAVDMDSDPHAFTITDVHNGQRSHTLQIEATADVIADLEATAAWRLTDVRTDYGEGWVRNPLTSRWKALFTASWRPRMGLWQVDVTCAVNGPGRMPRPYVTADGSLSWQRTYPAFCTLNAQATRNFRHWSVYVGGENLTGYRQKRPVIGADNPWGADFDATMVYAPLKGAMIYVGFRYNITKYI